MTRSEQKTIKIEVTRRPTEMKAKHDQENDQEMFEMFVGLGGNVMNSESIM